MGASIDCPASHLGATVDEQEAMLSQPRRTPRRSAHLVPRQQAVSKVLSKGDSPLQRMQRQRSSDDDAEMLVDIKGMVRWVPISGS
mmetsp:Transcript_95244/g.188742  ORF Transcript_95244/g.188742 Transcript_95244/m.188742 type:complete len:86 (+) Transcript_95244:86-343(+)